MNLQEQLFKSCLDELGKTQKLAEDQEQYEEWRETNWTSVEMEEE